MLLYGLVCTAFSERRFRLWSLRCLHASPLGQLWRSCFKRFLTGEPLTWRRYCWAFSEIGQSLCRFSENPIDFQSFRRSMLRNCLLSRRRQRAKFPQPCSVAQEGNWKTAGGSGRRRRLKQKTWSRIGTGNSRRVGGKHKKASWSHEKIEFWQSTFCHFRGTSLKKFTSIRIKLN